MADSDEFLFNADKRFLGADIITEFEVGIDTIAINYAEIAWFADGVSQTSEVNGSAVITFDDGASITITGVGAADLQAADFTILSIGGWERC